MKIWFVIFICTLFNLSEQLNKTKQGEVKQERPIIGILLQQSSFVDEYPPNVYSYLPAGYVKFMEMGGARVVPVYYDAPQSYYDELIPQLNGILFPGGNSDFDKGTKLGDTGYYIFQKAKEMNENGIHFPIWGTCQGFEMLLYYENDFSRDIFSPINDEIEVNHSIWIQHLGQLYGQMPMNLMDNAENFEVQFFYHHWAVTENSFNSHPKLRSSYYLSSLTFNSEGIPFVTSVESKLYPFFGTQFHPEDNNFEWKYPANHSERGALNTQYYANFFVQQARLNGNRFEDKQKESDLLIYNYDPVYTVNDTDYEQVYFIKNYNLTHTLQEIEQLEI